MKFTNENRNRFYGLRVGDIVIPKGLNGKPLDCGNCEVEVLSPMNNNAAYLKPLNEDNEPFAHVAEWCEIITPVDGQEGWKKLEPVKFLGEFEVDETTNPYHDFTKKNWALLYIQKYGQYRGEHHKLWVMDQVARILHGTPVHVVETRWGNKYGVTRNNFIHRTGEPSEDYKQWVHEIREWDEEGEYYLFDYDEGIAP